MLCLMARKISWVSVLACRVMLFELNRWQVPDRGVQPVGVVPMGRACDLPFDVSSVGPGRPARSG